MAKINQPQPWGINPGKAYVPILHEGEVVGFCQRSYADRIIDDLNHNELLSKAFNLACRDLLTHIGDESDTVDDLVQHYLAKAERPKSGTGAIALLLKERQEGLDLTDEEFAKFCDTFRLSREELRNIYAGTEIESTQLTPLARILGLSVDELIEVWKG